MKRHMPIGLLAVLGACAAQAVTHVTETADFVTGVETQAWTVSSGRWTSPSYPANVTHFSLSATNLADGAALTVTRQGNAFTLAASGEGRLTSFTVEYDVTKLPKPGLPAVTNIVDGGFLMTWAAIPDAVGYRLTFYTNRLEGAADGTAVFDETFNGLPADGETLPVGYFNSSTDTKADWTFETCYAPAGHVGCVQVGNASSDGWLSFAVPAAAAGAGRTLRVTARKAENAGPDMPVRHVSGGVTNDLGVIALGNATQDHWLALPDLTEGDRLIFASSTNKKDGRVILDRIALLEGYEPGTNVRDAFAETVVTDASFATNGMPLVAMEVTLTALAGDPADHSDASDGTAIDLANPPPMPILRACPISSLADGVFEADFSALSNITKTAASEWYNGVSPLAWWMGYNDLGQLVTTIARGTKSSDASRFYAFSDDSFDGYALAFRGSSVRDFYYGLAFVNDTVSIRTDLALSYDPIQWLHHNTSALPDVTVEYLITNEVVATSAAGAWTAIPALAFTPPYTATVNADTDDAHVPYLAPTKSTTLAGIVLKPGDVLILRFSDMRATNPQGACGLRAFRFSSARKPVTSCIILR